MSAVPKLRFPGFEGEWESVRLRDLVARMEAGAYAVVESRLAVDGEKGLLLTSAVTDGEFAPTEHKAVADPREAARLTEPVRAGSILISRINTTELVGASALVSEDRSDLFLPDRLWALSAREGESVRWIAQLLGSPAVRAAMGDRSAGTSGSMKYLTRDAVLDLPLRRAPPGEQEEIADFLAAVDARAALERRRLEALKRLKAGLLRGLFDGTLRFARGDGGAFPDWEKQTLGEVATFLKGRGVAKDEVVAGGATPCIRYGEVYTRYAERITDVASRTDADPSRLLLSEPGDIIVPASGETAEDMARACCVEVGGVALGGDLNVLRTATNPLFLAYQLTHACRAQIASVAQGASVVHLYAAQLRKIEVRLPHPDEQALIAGARATLDDRLALSRRTADALALLKRGLLQQMFV